METGITNHFKFLCCGILLLFLGFPVQGNVYLEADTEYPAFRDVSFVEAVKEISQRFNVFFTFDLELVEGITVDDAFRRMDDVENAVEYVLHKTDLNYRIIDTRYVIIYKNDQEGINSLKEMSKHLDGLISEGENSSSVRKRTLRVIPKLTSNWNIKKIERIAFTVSGIVTDQDGEPLIGVNIQVKNSSKGTATDFDGRFTLEDIDENAVLVISYVGYQTQEVSVAGKSDLEIVMTSDSQMLDEVIVVGYGTQKKSDLTGAVSRISLDDKSMLPNINLSQALSGSIAGVNLTTQGGAGGVASIEIRGQTTLSASRTPLFVVDGIIFNGSLNDINVNDIETIDVLKDASSAAVYGSRSANGVIIITTKKGSSDKPRISLNAYYGSQFETNHPVRYMDAEQYAIRMVDYYYQQGLYNWYATKPTSNAEKPVRPDINNREIVASFLRTKEEQDNYLAGNSIDWFDVVNRKNPIIQSYDLSYSGRTDRINYYLSGSHSGEEGIIKNDQWSRNTLNFKLDSKITDWITLGMNLNYSYQDYSGLEPEYGDVRGASPLANYDLDSPDDYVIYLTGENYMPHPLGRTKALNQDIRNSLFFVPSLKLDVPFVEGLAYEFNYSNSYYNRKNNTFFPSDVADGMTNSGKAEKIPEEQRNWIFNNIVSYSQDYGDHSLNGTLLYSREKYNGESYRFTAEGFDIEILGFDQMALGTKLTTGGNSKWQESGVSYMGRLNYSYKNRYMATATVRRDGFSGFGQDRKFVTLPSFALGWLTSEEAFMDNIDWLYLKTRLSYGENGNQGAGRYSSLARMNSQNYLFDNATAVSVFPNQDQLGNPLLGWERTSSFNLGFDFSLFRSGKVSGSLDVYTSNTSEVLVKRKLPSSSGYEEGWTNIGAVKAKGIDIEINTRNIDRGKLDWTSSIIYSLDRDKITKLYGDGGDQDIGNSWFVGHPIQTIYDYNIIGLWTEDELYSDDIYSGWYPGQWKYEDVNGDGVIDPDNDRKILGYKKPNFRIGFTNSLAYGNWSLYVMLNSVWGGNGYYMSGNTSYLNVAERSDDVYRLNQPSIRQYWTPDNGVTNATGIYNSQPQNGGIYQDRTFVRLQDISLMYRLNPSMLNTLGGFDNIQIYVSGKNLLTWTKWQGWDPEISRSHFPNTRNVVFGIRLGI